MNALLGDLTIFVLAIFVGYEVISKVPVILHTPLMSGTNAIHGYCDSDEMSRVIESLSAANYAGLDEHWSFRVEAFVDDSRHQDMAPVHASQMYSRNLLAFVQLMLKEGVLNLNFEDDILRDTCITHEGTIRNAATRDRLGAAAPAPATTGGLAP